MNKTMNTQILLFSVALLFSQPLSAIAQSEGQEVHDRDAVTAVENRETARKNLVKEVGLWRVSVAFGFVFDVADFVAALPGSDKHTA